MDAAGITALTSPVVNEAQSYHLLIADDHPLFRGALREAVTGLFSRAHVGEAGTFEEVTELIEKSGDVDLILLDLSMPGVRGFSGLMYLRAQFPSLPVVVVSANDDPAVIRRCMEFGASGFIPKRSASRPCARPSRRCCAVKCGRRRMSIYSETATPKAPRSSRGWPR